MITVTGRYTQNEVKELTADMDFRKPEYRREVFLRFYEFHLKNRSHPGGVYFAMPWLAKHLKQTVEDKLWTAFINGCSQNIVTTSIIQKRFPSIATLDLTELNNWWNIFHSKFKAGSGWDSDRKYFKIGKTGFPQCVESYKKQVDKFGSQEAMFMSVMNTSDVYQNFRNTWDFVRNNFLSFGRLSTFSYLEYLRIQGMPLDCDSLFLRDISGSKSHRNGLCKVLGRDDLDWYDVKDSHNPDFEGYSEEVLSWLEEEGALLLDEAKARIKHPDVSYFTLESTLCCCKSWYRPNRRYPNVYMDMMYNRIKYAESEWGPEVGKMFWQMRKECLPKNLRLEDNPADPGLCKEKQNVFRLTGKVIMMDKDWSVFKNPFNDMVDNTNSQPTTLDHLFEV
jgi:Alpha-glutamyl/putrescinyl thymine pyrophosphorylase clade 2